MGNAVCGHNNVMAAGVQVLNRTYDPDCSLVFMADSCTCIGMHMTAQQRGHHKATLPSVTTRHFCHLWMSHGGKIRVVADLALFALFIDGLQMHLPTADIGTPRLMELMMPLLLYADGLILMSERTLGPA